MASTAKHDWPMVRLGDVCEISAGGTPKRSVSSYFNGEIPWVKIGDMEASPLVTCTEETITHLGLQESSAKLWPAGTILLSIFATVGRVAVLGVEAASNQAIAGLRIVDERVDRHYLVHYLRSLEKQLKHKGRGVAQNNVNLKLLRELEIPLPPLDEQRRIAAILDELVALITKIDVEMSVLQKVQHSRLNEVLRHCPQVPLKTYVESIQSGRSVKEASTDEVRNRVLKISAVTSGSFEPGESKPLPDDYAPADAHQVQKGDVLVSRANTAELVGASALVVDEVKNLYLPDKLWRLNLAQGAQAAAIVGILQSATVRSRISAKASGSGGSMKNITQKAFLQVLVPQLGTGEQERLSRFLMLIGSVRELLLQKRLLLEALSLSLSTRAFQGEL